MTKDASVVHIFDFDWTLILENSSRLLEIEIFNLLPKSIFRFTVYFFFFSPLKIVFDKAIYWFSRFFFRSKDLRLYIFLKLHKKILKNNYNLVIANVIDRMTLNFLLIQDVEIFCIISNWFEDIIEKFLEIKWVDYKEIIASRYELSGDALTVELNSNITKLAFLKQVVWDWKFVYYTDDPREKDIILRDMNHLNSVELNLPNFSIYKIFN